MQTVAVLSQKGGAGKTTLALNLAVAGRLKGKVTAVIDLDPQASAAQWSDAREGEPAVVSAQHGRLEHVLKTAAEAGCKMSFIDTAPHSETVALAAARAADLILIPCRPAIFDLRSVQASVELAKLAGKTAYIVLNAVPHQGSLGEDAAKAMKGVASVAPYRLSQRAAYVHAATQSQGVCEFEPQGKACLEVSNLYRWLTKLLKESK